MISTLGTVAFSIHNNVAILIIGFLSLLAMSLGDIMIPEENLLTTTEPDVIIPDVIEPIEKIGDRWLWGESGPHNMRVKKCSLVSFLKSSTWFEVWHQGVLKVTFRDFVVAQSYVEEMLDA